MTVGNPGPLSGRVSAWQALVLLPVGVLLGAALVLAVAYSASAELARDLCERWRK